MTESIYITMRKNFCFYGGKERKGGNLIYPSIIGVFDKISRAMTDCHIENETADDSIKPTGFSAGKSRCEHAAVLAVEEPIPVGYRRTEGQYARYEKQA